MNFIVEIMKKEIETEESNDYSKFDEERIIQYMNGKYVLEEGEYIGSIELTEELKMLKEIYR
jgi:hypothetical protein